MGLWLLFKWGIRENRSWAPDISSPRKRTQIHCLTHTLLISIVRRYIYTYMDANRIVDCWWEWSINIKLNCSNMGVWKTPCIWSNGWSINSTLPKAQLTQRLSSLLLRNIKIQFQTSNIYQTSASESWSNSASNLDLNSASKSRQKFSFKLT